MFKRLYSAQASKAPLSGMLKRQKVTLDHVKKLYHDRTPIAMLTATDYPSARLCEVPYQQYTNLNPSIDPCIDIVLVGDSLAMVDLGHDDTVEVTLDQMIHHSKAVRRGISRPLLVTDMPFGTYKVCEKLALQNAYRLCQEAGVDAVKVEGGIGDGVDSIVRNLVRGGVATMAHVGLTPQTYKLSSGYKAQGTSAKKAFEIFLDCIALQDAGAFSIVLECVPHKVAQVISQNISIPTIGIGAGSSISQYNQDNNNGSVNGQVLVQSDMLGIYGYEPTENERAQDTVENVQFNFSQQNKISMPKFCTQFAPIGEMSHYAITEYAYKVKSGSFPSNAQHGFKIQDKEFEKFASKMEQYKSRLNIQTA
ncbi:hypothetical protein MP228_008066 [Amoeboaphelidium protococcarum]|nr:hypothetical protein MP228_008066 [Amoeboaphelidium protococcarum]